MSSPGKAPQGPKVSPARTIASLIVLLVVGVVCLIEMRAGLGQYLSGKELKGVLGGDDTAAPLKSVRFAEAKALLSMSPTEELVRETTHEKVYRFSWYSLLRPLIGEPSPQIFISVTTDADAIATGFFTSEDEQPGAGYVYQQPPEGAGSVSPPPLLPPPSDVDGAPGAGGPGPGGPGGMRMPGGFGGMMGPPGGGQGRKRPAMEGDEKAAPVEEKADGEKEKAGEEAGEKADEKAAEEAAEKAPETDAGKAAEKDASASPAANDAKP